MLKFRLVMNVILSAVIVTLNILAVTTKKLKKKVRILWLRIIGMILTGLKYTKMKKQIRMLKHGGSGGLNYVRHLQFYVSQEANPYYSKAHGEYLTNLKKILVLI